MNLFNRTRLSARLRHAERVIVERALSRERQLSGGLALLSASIRIDIWDGADAAKVEALWRKGVAQVESIKRCRILPEISERCLARLLALCEGNDAQIDAAG